MVSGGRQIRVEVRHCGRGGGFRLQRALARRPALIFELSWAGRLAIEILVSGRRVDQLKVRRRDEVKTASLCGQEYEHELGEPSIAGNNIRGDQPSFGAN